MFKVEQKGRERKVRDNHKSFKSHFSPFSSKDFDMYKTISDISYFKRYEGMKRKRPTSWPYQFKDWKVSTVEERISLDLLFKLMS